MDVELVFQAAICEGLLVGTRRKRVFILWRFCSCYLENCPSCDFKTMHANERELRLDDLGLVHTGLDMFENGVSTLKRQKEVSSLQRRRNEMFSIHTCRIVDVKGERMGWGEAMGGGNA